MLITPLSAVVQHRLEQFAGMPPREANRLAQVRPGMAGQSGDLASYPPAGETTYCPACGGGLQPRPVLAAAEAIRRLRPPARTEIDQCHVDCASLARRVAALVASRPMGRTRVAFVGDDDLASVMLLQTAPPEYTLLLDIDERIVAAVSAEAVRLGLSSRVRAERADLSSDADRSAVLDQYGETFDLVVTDPPYAHDGMSLFVRTAMTLTAYTGEVHIAVPALLAEAWTDELLHAVQLMLANGGFVIDQLIRGAFVYETSGVISSLIIARRLPGGPPARDPQPTATARFYTTRIPPRQQPLLRPAQQKEGP